MQRHLVSLQLVKKLRVPQRIYINLLGGLKGGSSH
jgi:hypothetical protein